MNEEMEHVQKLLADTVLLLCKNGISFQKHIRVQGLLGVTVDDTVFLVHINELVQNSIGTTDEINSGIIHLNNLKSEEYTQAYRENENSEVNLHRPATRTNTRKKLKQSKRTSNGAHAIPHGNQYSENYNDCITIKDEYDDAQSTLEMTGVDGNNRQDLLANFNGFDVDSGATAGDITNELYDDAENGDESGTVWQDDPSTSWGLEGEGVDEQVSWAQPTSTSVKRERMDGVPRHSALQMDNHRRSAMKSIVSKYKQQHHHQQSNAYVTTLHQCSYPGCNKHYRQRKDLLRHQTQKHGRTPTKILTYGKFWTRTT